MLHAALREAVEETSLAVRPLRNELHDVDVHEFPERNGRAAHLHLDCRFALVADDPDALRPSDESLDVRWFTRDEAARSDASVRRMIAKLPRE